jgi:predicted GNAT family N-acyltransferase
MSPDFKLSTAILPPPGSSISKPRHVLENLPDTPQIFKDAMAVRYVVFVDEQSCSAEEELDDDDARSWHWVIYSEPANPSSPESNAQSQPNEQTNPIPIGVIRLVPPPHAPHVHEHNGNGPSPQEESASSNQKPHNKDLPYIKITRVAVLKEYRGKGLARVLVDTVLEWAAQHAEELSSAISNEGERWDGLVLVHSQVAVESVYTKLGFVTDPSMGTWVEEGIDHIALWKRIEVASPK